MRRPVKYPVRKVVSAPKPPPAKPAEPVESDAPEPEEERVVDEPVDPEPVAEPNHEGGTPPDVVPPVEPSRPPMFAAPMTDDRKRFLLQQVPGFTPGEVLTPETQELMREGYFALCEDRYELTAKGRELMGK